MLKKVVINFFVTIEIIMVLVIIFETSASAAPVGQYVRCGYIEDVDSNDNFTVLVTEDGNVWFWESTTYQTKSGQKMFPVGAKIVAVINGNGTAKVTDDELVDFEIYK